MTEIEFANTHKLHIIEFVTKMEKLSLPISELEKLIGFEVSPDLPVEVGIFEFSKRKALKKAGIPYKNIFRMDKAKEISEDVLELLPIIFQIIIAYKQGINQLRK